MAEKYNASRSVDPTLEPVTVGQAKDHLRVATSVDDTVIAMLIASSRLQVERDTGKSLITQTWELALDCFPSVGDYIRLDYGPVQSITSIYYNDSNGNATLWDSSNYQLKNTGNPALVIPAYNGSWPTDYAEERRGITVTYVTGYGANHTTVPAELRQAVLLRVEMLYDGEQPHLVDAYKRIVDSNRTGLY